MFDVHTAIPASCFLELVRVRPVGTCSVQQRLSVSLSQLPPSDDKRDWTQREKSGHFKQWRCAMPMHTRITVFELRLKRRSPSFTDTFHYFEMRHRIIRKTRSSFLGQVLVRLGFPSSPSGLVITACQNPHLRCPYGLAGNTLGLFDPLSFYVLGNAACVLIMQELVRTDE
jgi:hypothetical protein